MTRIIGRGSATETDMKKLLSLAALLLLATAVLAQPPTQEEIMKAKQSRLRPPVECVD